jgi:hypothetical protein
MIVDDVDIPTSTQSRWVMAEGPAFCAAGSAGGCDAHASTATESNVESGLINRMRNLNHVALGGRGELTGRLFGRDSQVFPELHLYQFVGAQGVVQGCNHACGDPADAQVDDRVEVVCFSTERRAIFTAHQRRFPSSSKLPNGFTLSPSQ